MLDSQRSFSVSAQIWVQRCELSSFQFSVFRKFLKYLCFLVSVTDALINLISTLLSTGIYFYFVKPFLRKTYHKNPHVHVSFFG